MALKGFVWLGTELALYVQSSVAEGFAAKCTEWVNAPQEGAIALISPLLRPMILPLLLSPSSNRAKAPVETGPSGLWKGAPNARDHEWSSESHSESRLLSRSI